MIIANSKEYKMPKAFQLAFRLFGIGKKEIVNFYLPGERDSEDQEKKRFAFRQKELLQLIVRVAR